MENQNNILNRDVLISPIGSKLDGKFTVTRIRHQTLKWAVLDGIQDEHSVSVQITLTTDSVLIERLQLLARASHMCQILQPVLFADFNEALTAYYFVVASDIEKNLMPLSNMVGFSMEKKLTIALDICKAVEQIHNTTSLSLFELSPDMILIDKESGAVMKILFPSNYWMIPSSLSTLLRYEYLNAETNFIKVIDDESLQNCLRELVRSPSSFVCPNWWHISFNAFIAPECTYLQNASKMTDMYSLGVIIYWLFKDSIPFQNISIGRLMSEILPPAIYSDLFIMRTAECLLLNKIIGISENNLHSIPIQIQSAIIRATQKNPDDRYKNAYELATDLSIATKKLKITVVDDNKHPVFNMPLIIKRHGTDFTSEIYNALTNKDGVYEGLFFSGEYSLESLGNNIYDKLPRLFFEIIDVSKDVVIVAKPLSISEILSRKWLDFKLNLVRTRKQPIRPTKKINDDVKKGKEK